MQTFTLLFLIALALTTSIKFWLIQRQIRYIQANRAQVPTEFSSQIPLEAHQKAADYTIEKARLEKVDLVIGVIVLLALTLGGGLQFLFDFWQQRFSPTDYSHGIALIANVVILTGLIDLPLNLYRIFSIEQRFGFNKMTRRLFVIDLFKQILLSVVIGVPLLFCVLWLMNEMGTYWWFYVWLFLIGFNLIALMVYPTWIAPLFNKFTPLNDANLRTRIEALLAKCGFKSNGLFVMDGSKRSSHGNAYFTGFGAAKRIVFFDTLIQQLQPSEVEAVLAHELGHYKYHHVWKRATISLLLTLVFLWILGFLINQPWFYQGLNAQSQSTALALLLFSFVVPLFTFPFTAWMSALSRRHEFEADRYAAKQANSEDLAQALVKMYRDNASTLTPDPVYVAFYYSHPPAQTRIARLREPPP